MTLSILFLLLLLHFALSATRKCTAVCSRTLFPVCGEDSEGLKTYGNMCELRKDGCLRGDPVTFVRFGGCDSGNGSRNSQLESRNSKESKEGSKGLSPDIAPDEIVAGKSSGNLELVANDEVSKNGDADESDLSKDIRMRGSSDFTLSSIEVRQRLGLTSLGCDRVCVKKAQPVCGSDGVTYQNACMLRKAQCEDSTLEKTIDGPCPEATKTTLSSSPCEYNCPDEVSPVCSTDGETFKNSCLFALAQCANPFLDIDHEGECLSSPLPSKKPEEKDLP